MRTVVLLRSCPDYSKMTKENFESLMVTPFALSYTIQEMLEYDVLDIWESSFKLNYFEYRQELASIAKETINATGCEVIYGHQEFDEWFEQEEDVLVVPINDDDWLSPRICELPKSLDESKDLLLWTNATLHSITKCQFTHGDGIYFGSSNWAIRKSALKGLGIDESKQIVLGPHKDSEKRIKQEIDKKRWALDQKRHSVFNRHIADFNFIRKQIDQTNFRRELPKIGKRAVVSCEIPDELAWSAEYFKRLVRLNIKLREGAVVLL